MIQVERKHIFNCQKIYPVFGVSAMVILTVLGSYILQKKEKKAFHSDSPIIIYVNNSGVDFKDDVDGTYKYTLNSDEYFNFNDSSLTEDGKKQIVKISNFLKTKNLFEILIVGYSDRIGSIRRKQRYILSKGNLCKRRNTKT